MDRSGRAGRPYTNLLISHDQSDRVVDDSRIKGVALTGSVAAGQSVAAKPGGKSRFHRWNSVEAMRSSFSKTPISTIPSSGPSGARMYNTGQTCCAAKRFIVVEAACRRVLREVPGGARGSQAGRSDGREDDAGTASSESALVDLLKQVDARRLPRRKIGWAASVSSAPARSCSQRS